MDNLLNIPEAAAYLNISPDTLTRLVERDEAPAKKAGGSWRLTRSRLEEFVSSRSPRRRPRVLVIEPGLDESLRLLGYIEAQGFDNQAVATVEEAVNLPGDESWDLVFMTARSASGTLQEIAGLRQIGPEARIVLIIESDSTADALAALDGGPIIALMSPVSESDIASILTLVSS